jgi:hypothetical protein
MTGTPIGKQSVIEVMPVKTADDTVRDLPPAEPKTPLASRAEDGRSMSTWGIVKENPWVVFWGQSKLSLSGAHDCFPPRELISNLLG